MENQENSFETKTEKIPTKQEVLEVIEQYIEGAVFVKELSDEKGLYLLEVAVEGENPGEVIQYEYMRKGRHSNQNSTIVTGIDIVYYRDEVPYDGGGRIAEFDEGTGEWKKLQ